LARAVAFAVGQLATMLVDRYFNHFFQLFHHFPAQPCIKEQLFRGKFFFKPIPTEAPKPQGLTPITFVHFWPSWAILDFAGSTALQAVSYCPLCS